MPTDTYSLAIQGAPADNQQAPLTLIELGDSSARPGGAQLAMSQGTQVLCRNQDGSQSWYTIDAERSRPGGPYYLLKV